MLSDDADNYLRVGRSLIENFEQVFEQDELSIKTRDPDTWIKAGMVLGLSLHTHRLGALILDLLERETAMVLVLPNLRACYEAAVTSHWIAQSTDAAVAAFNEEVRQRRNLSRTLSKASIPLQEHADRIAHADLPDEQTSSSVQAKSVEKMLEDFDNVGTDAYAYYRLLSWYSHAGVSLVDQYLDEDPATAFALRLEPKQPIPSEAAIYLIACCLVWAGSAARYVQKDPTRRRKELRDVAKTLGISPDLHLSSKALLRQPGKR
ncbi:hypothetical protein [Nocardia farcinica]|nr:hypothetical protein [Nocardia farcinica]MBF6574147.1 hypothetical protein [Nocardia farcinica]